ncbi:MAG: LPS assembly lipoprotein LptE [Nevskiales bacterium]
MAGKCMILGISRGIFRAAGFVLLLLLTGCGFSLKGDKPLPPELSDVYLQVASGGVIQSRLEESLRTLLKRRGARVVYDATAPGRLAVARLEEKTRVLSVDPTGKGIEYEIETTVEFDYSLNGRLRVPRETLTALRDYSFDDTRVLAKEAERKQLRREMQEELANLILLRIDAVLRNPPPDLVPAAEPAG